MLHAKKIIYLSLFLALLIFIPHIVHAESLLYLDCYASNNCGMCDALQLMTKVFNIILMLTGSLSVLMFVIAGLILISSQGVPGRLQSAKRIIFGSLTGILIVYTAWVGVNFIIYSFAGGQAKTGQGVATIFSQPWNQLECIDTQEEWLALENPGEIKPAAISTGCKSAWETGTEPGCGGNVANYFQLSSDLNPAQSQDASPALMRLVQCMHSELTNPQTVGRYNNILTVNDIIITSVSDNNGLKRCRDNHQRPPCFHMNNSCHYGHGQTDGSYAIDIRSHYVIFDGTRQPWLNSSQETLLETLVNRCQGNILDERYVVVNGTRQLSSAPHYHISAIECGGR